MMHGLARITIHGAFEEVECFCKSLFGSWEDFRLHEQGVKVQQVQRDRWEIGV